MSTPSSQHLSLPPSQNTSALQRHPNSRSHARPSESDKGFRSLTDYTPPDSPGGIFTSLPPLQMHNTTPPAFPVPVPGRPTPPPIDPGVFRNVTTIRRLIDEAAELSVRASSGLSAASLSSMRNGTATGSWAAAHALGLDGAGNAGGGRNVAMSAMRIHRLRALAVQKLAAAYKADEIASSVMVMQGGSVFDDIAERVLKHGTRGHSLLTSSCRRKLAPQIRMTQTHNMCTSFTRKYPLGASNTMQTHSLTVEK